MSFSVPRRYFLVSGCSEAPTELNAFDGALRQAGVGDVNLLKVSSIVPPACRRIDPIALPKGALIPIAYASISSDKPGEVIAAAIAVGIPEEIDQVGVIMEHSAVGHQAEVEKIATDMARTALEMRGLSIKSIESRAVEIKVKDVAAAFAGVALIP
ncbi:MAG: arginine decarboxylase, pyruvoyl-dependent [bacterium]|nr:arginine decarboxylase, pyruvoyl-dependent [bacterium]